MEHQEDDQLISIIPIRYSNALAPNLQIQQFPLLTRPLQVPPSAVQSGKRIRARIKPNARRIEVHVPVDARPEVWNAERAADLGAAQAVDDREKNQERSKGKQREEEEPRLEEVRLRSERIPQQGVYMLGVIRDGQLHLHPINETHQLRPSLTYLDVLSRRSKPSKSGIGSDSDMDDGPPPDPDEPVAPPISSSPKKEKKVAEAKEAQVSTRKVEDKGNMQYMQGGLSAVRREMLMAMRNEEDEKWEDLEFYDGESEESGNALNVIFSQRNDSLGCKSDMTAFLKDIQGL